MDQFFLQLHKNLFFTRPFDNFPHPKEKLSTQIKFHPFWWFSTRLSTKKLSPRRYFSIRSSSGFRRIPCLQLSAPNDIARGCEGSNLPFFNSPRYRPFRRKCSPFTSSGSSGSRYAFPPRFSTERANPNFTLPCLDKQGKQAYTSHSETLN